MVKLFLDIIVINLSFLFAYYLRFSVFGFLPGDVIPATPAYFQTFLLITVLWLAVFKLMGLYEFKKPSSFFDEAASIFISVTVATILLLGFLFLYRGLWYSRLLIINAWAVSILLLWFSRLALYAFQKYLKTKGVGIKRTLIIGADEIGQTIVNKARCDRSLGYSLIGFLDDALDVQGKKIQDIPVLGKVADAAAIVQKYRINEVIIASKDISQQTILDIITECEKYGVEFKIVPGILELIASRVDVDDIGGVPLLTVKEIQLKGMNAAIKRTFDVGSAAAGIIIISPLLLVFALLVKVTSPGPVLIFQKRVGKDGQSFSMFKFRSMIQGAEELKSELERYSETQGHIFKIKDDPRMTLLGRFMRRSSIDELPQLFNVLKGDMSLVGPRPPLPDEVEKYNAWQKKRLRVLPGITGLWQVSGRSLLPFDDMVRLDIYYIENWTLWQDFKILLRTVPVVITGSGAY